MSDDGFKPKKPKPESPESNVDAEGVSTTLDIYVGDTTISKTMSGGTGKFSCPCGGVFQAFTKPIACVLHDIPYCSDFERMEPDRYLEWARLQHVLSVN